MESFLLASWIEEIRETVQGLPVSEIIEYEKDLLAIRFSRRGGELRFRLTPGKVYGCLLPATAGDGAKPRELLSDLRGARVLSLVKQPGDRVLELRLDTDLGKNTLMIELIPGFPNMFLLDGSGAVLWMFRKDNDRKRALDHGSVYQ